MLLILLSENWLSRTYACCNLLVHQIFGTLMYVDTNSSVRLWQILYVNYILQYVNGNAVYLFNEDERVASPFWQR